MKSFDYYEGKDLTPLPAKPTKPLLRPHAPSGEVAIYLDKLKKYEVNTAEWDALKAIRTALMGKLKEEFEKDLMEEFGLIDHPKADKIFSYVWEKGHSYGFREVYTCMEEIIELF